MIRLVHRRYDPEASLAVKRVLDSGWVAMGPMTEQLEMKLTDITQMAYAIATNSCTSALYVAFRTCLRQGQRVIMSPFTFASAMHAIVMSGAVPVFVDIDCTTGNISADSLSCALHGQADAILVSHYAGIPCSSQVIGLARQHKLTIIDDSAHALGATRNGIPIQMESDVACLSFNSTKIFSSGEGGAVVTNSKDVANMCRLLRNYGMTKTCAQKAVEGPSFDIRAVSLNLKFNDILAAVLCPQIGRSNMATVLSRRAAIAEAYRCRLQNTDCGLLYKERGDEPSWLFFPVVLPRRLASRQMNVVRFLRSRDVEASILFPDLVGIAADLGICFCDHGHPAATDMSSRVITLPCHEYITEHDVQYIVEQLLDAVCNC